MPVEDEDASGFAGDHNLVGMVGERLSVTSGDGVQEKVTAGHQASRPVLDCEGVEHPDCRDGKYWFPSPARPGIGMKALLPIPRQWSSPVGQKLRRVAEELLSSADHYRVVTTVGGLGLLLGG